MLVLAGGIVTGATQALAAGSGAGTDIGNAALLNGSVTGTLQSADQDDWYVFYPATPETQVTVRVANTLNGATGTCSYLFVSLLNTDGQAVTSIGIPAGQSEALSSSNPSEASDRYFVALDDNNCTPTVGPDVSYEVYVTTGGGGAAASPAAASSAPGTSIDNVAAPLQGGRYYTGKLPDASSDDWYVLYKAGNTSPATVRIQNTTATATNPGCTDMDATLTNTDGQAIDSQGLPQDTAVVWPLATGGRYFLELTDNSCNPGSKAPVTYSIEPEPASEWVNPPAPPQQTLKGGVSKAGAAVLSSGIEYNGTVPGANTAQWFKGQAGAGQSSWVIQNGALVNENCRYIYVTLFNSAGQAIDSQGLPDDTAVEWDVSVAGTYYIEVTDNDCDPTSGTGLTDPPPFQLRESSNGGTTTTTAPTTSTTTARTTTTAPTTTLPATTSTTVKRENKEPLEYVAIGDSVAAGEGIAYGWHWAPASADDGRWQETTPNPSWLADNPLHDPAASVQGCHRSADAYPFVVARALGATSVKDVACTGSTGGLNTGMVNNTGGVRSPHLYLDGNGHQRSTPPPNKPQLDIFSTEQPGLVTVTLGANDINFAAVARQCYGTRVGNPCRPGTALDRTEQTALGEEKANLSDVLEDIESRTRGHRPLIAVTEYYNPFPTNANARCADTVPRFLGFALSVVGERETWMVGLLEQMDGNISEDVAEMDARYGNVLAVDLRLVPHIDEHRWCSADPWFYGPSIAVAVPGNPAPFHPTVQGQSAIGDYLAAKIQRWLSTHSKGAAGYGS